MTTTLPMPHMLSKPLTQAELQTMFQMGHVAMFAYARDCGASDVHLSPTASAYQFRLRIRGQLLLIGEITPETGRTIISAIKAAGKLNITETRKPQDGRLNPEGMNGLDIRLATHPALHGENLVARLLVHQEHQTLEQLGLNPKTLLAMHRVLNSESGLFLVVGSTGSGKTTTLHAALNALGEKAGRVSTLEDPVEIINPNALQTDLSRLPHLDFAQGLRSLMRQDPDTILVGEIRDAETANLTLQAALTGHRVLATLHAPDGLGALCRLVELDVRLPSLLNCLNAVMAQRLDRMLPPQQGLQEQIEVHAKAQTSSLVLPKQVLATQLMHLQGLPRARLLACKGLDDIQTLLNAHPQCFLEHLWQNPTENTGSNHPISNDWVKPRYHPTHLTEAQAK